MPIGLPMNYLPKRLEKLPILESRGVSESHGVLGQKVMEFRKVKSIKHFLIY